MMARQLVLSVLTGIGIFVFSGTVSARPGGPAGFIRVR